MFGLGKKKKKAEEAAKSAETHIARASQEAAAPEAEEPAAPAAPSVLAPPPANPGEVIPGLMQDQPINLASILEHAARSHGRQVMVTALIEGGKHTQTYAETLTRTKQLANALRRLGAAPGDRIATLAWNTHRHVEAWYAISGQGAICHTVNPRLAPEQIIYILNHAEDSILFTDATFAKLVDAVRPHVPSLKHVIVLTDRANMPEGEGYLCYEDLIAVEEPEFEWPSFPEDTASSLCYTSGTTGDPKGVLYGHRSNLLQSYAICSKDCQNLGVNDTTLMVVPMFHANAWGLVYGGPMVGAKLVLPGMSLDGASIHRLIKEEQVTGSAAVPTVWSMLLAHLDKTGEDLKPLTEVIIGGSAVPRSMIRTLGEKYGVTVVHGWGMTEMSPTGTVCRLGPQHEGLSLEEKLDVMCKQGRPLFGVEMKIVDDDNNELAWDGEQSGRLLVRGPWIAKSYFRRDDVIVDKDGFLDTGDVATIDADGYMQITDRAKDVIKSGGEWISSVDLENAAMGAEGVELACAVGVPHPKWEERPILLVVPKEGASPDPEDIKAHLLKASFAKWQLPDDIVFVKELPMTATGKFDKKVVRAEYKDHLMNQASDAEPAQEPAE
ncbi:MAG: long-chain fatty acid--CoA ligase [Maricaulaceae bacterium]|jgi:fatty-acyl-CoA synthase